VKQSVAIAGGFDPLHRGHIDHIKKAAELGRLTVIVQSDEILKRKKGYFLLPLEDRMAVVSSIKGVSIVTPNIDKDGTCAETLKLVKPEIFAKGGDRTPDNMPQNEKETCKEIGCEIIYGVGDLLNSSSDIVRRLRNIFKTKFTW